MSAYNIVKYPWHIGHDFELCKIPHNFHFLTNTYRNWSSNYRDFPEDVRWISGLDKVNADAMILHLDQWSYHEASKRFLFESFKNRFKGPKVVIIHGCNMLDGCSSKEMKRMVEGCHVVVNSPTALKLWDLDKSRFILHGMSKEEWPQSTYKSRKIIVVQPSSERHAITRNDEGMSLAEARVLLTWVGRDVHCRNSNDYKKLLSNSSIFFNPSHASANPRARAEAMLCGLVVVTTCSHGEQDYIENGVNGFCSNDVSELVEYMEYLLAHPEKIEIIGKKGRETAQRLFGIERFCLQWCDLLDEMIENA